MPRLGYVAEMAFAGAFVGYLIGPGSLDEFFGWTFDNSVMFNIAVGAAIGAALGLIASLATQAEHKDG